MTTPARWDRFDGLVVVVTGAAQGIGEGIARGFAVRGASVVLADVNADGARGAVEALRRQDCQVVAVHADVTNIDSVRAMVEAAHETFGRVDVLVNAAGGFGKPAAVEELSLDDWRGVVDLNLMSAFLCCQAVVPRMKARRGGRIINISSDAGRMPLVLTGVHYAAAKAGLLGLTRHLARELGPFGITVNAVAPGTTRTPRVTQLHDTQKVEWITALTPLGRIAEVDDQVGPVLFLASEAARYITGATLDVNGGRLML